MWLVIGNLSLLSFTVFYHMFSSFWGIYLFWINLKFVVMHEMPPKLSDSRKTIKYLDLKTLELLQNEQ